MGMPSDPDQAHKGLGTSIVQALAAQLQAVVDTQAARPGTRVEIAHTQIALVDSGAGARRGAGRPHTTGGLTPTTTPAEGPRS